MDQPGVQGFIQKHSGDGTFSECLLNVLGLNPIESLTTGLL